MLLFVLTQVSRIQEFLSAMATFMLEIHFVLLESGVYFLMLTEVRLGRRDEFAPRKETTECRWKVRNDVIC